MAGRQKVHRGGGFSSTLKESLTLSSVLRCVQVTYLQATGQYLTVSKGGTVVLWDGGDVSPQHAQQLRNSTVAPKDLWVTDIVLLPNINKVTFPWVR